MAGWIAVRGALLWGAGDLPPGIRLGMGLAAIGLATPPPLVDRPARVRSDPPARIRIIAAIDMARGSGDPGRASSAPMPAPPGDASRAPQSWLRHAPFADPAADAAPPLMPRMIAAAPGHESRWSGTLFLFLRPGSGRAGIAAGGQLGGSQAGGRIAYRLNPAGPVRTAIAARLHAPIESRGAEAAVGLDWHPLPNAPLRLSAERRVALDRAGRNAWSAYAAGGFYAGHLPFGIEADGYAQAGVVGARRQDLFVDGAVRAGKRMRVAGFAMVIGGGLWGAAQPGVARLDIGPRAGVALPIAGRTATLALESRMRIAGRARPGSGAVLTLAADF